MSCVAGGNHRTTQIVQEKRKIVGFYSAQLCSKGKIRRAGEEGERGGEMSYVAGGNHRTGDNCARKVKVGNSMI